MPADRTTIGRPTKYSPEMVNRAIAYLESCQDTEERVITGESEKFTTYKQKLRVSLPTIEGLAVHLGLHKETIYEWEKIHEDFSDVINDLKARQVKELLNKGLSGDYNPIIARLVLGKHGYTDKQDVNVEVKAGQSFKIGGQTIEF